MRFFTVLMTLLIALLFAGGMSQAAPSAYLRAEAAAPASWDAPLTVRIVSDEKWCREKYGKNWETGCDAQVGEYNAPARGIRLEPAVEGVWRWEYSRNLTFTPTQPLAPATTYTVLLDGLPLSSGVVFTNPKATLTTLPLAAIIGEDQLWIDPSAKGAHGVSCSIRFTWPVEPEAMARRISLLPADPDAGLRLGNTEFVWSQNRDQVTITARIDRFPEQATPLEVRVTGLPRAAVENGETTILKTAGTKVASGTKDASVGKERKTASRDAVYRFSIKGASELFSITALRLKTGHDTGLEQEYRLELETSLHARPADVIKVMQLVRLPHTNTPEAVTPYDWNRAPHIAPEDLDRGTPLRLETLQPENEPAGKMVFRIRGLEATGLGRYLFAWLPAGFTSSSGLTLPSPYTQVINAEPLRAELDFLQPGNVLALGGERKLDIHSSGLTAIKWEVAQVREPFLALLAQASGRLSEPLRSFDGQQYEALSEVVRGDIQLSGKTDVSAALAPRPGTPQFSVLDLAPLLRKDASDRGQIRGLMQVTLLGMHGDKPASNAFDDPLTVRRFLLVTDLGLMVKKGASGTREVFVSSLSTGTPVSGVLVQILGVNGMSVLEARTNAEGRATLASVSGLEREKRPVALVASHGDDLAWMPLGDTSLKVDTSAFPTAGRTSVSAGVIKDGMPLEGINAYVFGQRGLFRPGETVCFGMIVRRGDWTPLPADLPLEAVLVNPAGDVVLTRPFSVGGDGMASLSWNAPVSAMTGRYRLDVRVGGGDEGIVLGTGAVRLEEFQPDTLALSARILPETAAGWLVLDAPPAAVAAEAEKDVAPVRNDPRAEVVLRNLYGLPAGDRRIRATMRVVPAALQFPGYEEFIFHDATPYRGETFQETLPEVRTDKDGKASVLLPLSRLQSGTMRCEVLLEGFEPGGGRAVSLQREVVVSPLRTVLGYRTTGAGTNLAFLPQGRDTALEFVALDAHLKPVATGPLTFVVSGRRYVSSLVTDAAGRYRYDEVPVDTELSRSTGTIAVLTDAASGTEATAASAVTNNLWKIPTEQPGEYLLTVRGADKQIMASVPFTVAGESLRLAEAQASAFSETPGVKLASGKLRLRIDKTDYDAGEHIRLFVSTPYDGAGLITLERDGVFAHVWFRAKAGDSVHSIAIPDDFEGRGYVSVSLARSLDSPDIYMEPHSSAVVPFTASIRKRDMGLALAAPERVRPGDTVSVRLTARHPGKALVFAVDEGVLQLTSFQTPAPLDYLLLDRALEVETMQTFNVLMPDHAKLWGRIPGFGGDMASSGGRFLNPFKRRGEPPLAFWSGLVEVHPEGTVVTFPVPDYYNGKVRVMAVGSSGATVSDTSHPTATSFATVGSAETAVTVRGPLVLTPQLPLAVVPGDIFEGFIALANNEIAGSSGKAPSFALHLDTGAAFSLVGDMPSRVEVPEREEVVLPFRLKANDIPGAAEIRFRVTGTDGTTALAIVREAALSVRPATHRLATQRSGVATRTVRIETGRQLYPFDASGSASVASVPLPALRGLVRYLDAYPHGCVEQLLSRAFPYVLLSGRADLLVDPRRDEQTIRKQTEDLIAAALSALQAGFRRGAGVSLWPGGEPDDLLTVYAGDFLLGLRESGRGVSALDGAVFDVIEQITGRSPSSLEDARIKAYGIWVLTREGRVTSQAVEQLVAWLHTEVAGWRKDVTASLLAGSCAIMRQDDLAQQFLAGYDATFKTFNTTGFMDFLAVQSLHTAVLARHFPANLKGDVAVQLVDSALNAVRQGQTTFSAAQGVRALLELSAVSRRAGTPLGGLRLTCVEGGVSDTAAQGVLFGDLLMLEAPGCLTYELQVPANNTTPWYWQVSSNGFDRVAPAQAGGQGMEVVRVYRDPVTGEPLTSVALGDEVVVDVRVQAHGIPSGLLENIAVVDLLPGGFEMVLPRGNHREDAPPSTGKAGLTRMERREDRMIFFGNAGAEPLTCSYRIRAVNRGQFTLPPVQAEAMYAPALSAHSAAGSIEVK